MSPQQTLSACGSKFETSKVQALYVHRGQTNLISTHDCVYINFFSFVHFLGGQKYIILVYSYVIWMLKIRGASHYGRRSRGRKFPPIILQETKSLASQPFTLRVKVQRSLHFIMLIFLRRRHTLKGVWVGREWKPKLWSTGYRFFFHKEINH